MGSEAKENSTEIKEDDKHALRTTESLSELLTNTEKLTELLTNAVNMTASFYDIFLNPNPLDVTFEQYDNHNTLIKVTIPNRAKDRVIAIVGNGSPEGVQEAEIGTFFIDQGTETVYVKMKKGVDTGEGEDPSAGWEPVLTANQAETIMTPILANYLVKNDYQTGTMVDSTLEKYVLGSTLSENYFDRKATLQKLKEYVRAFPVNSEDSNISPETLTTEETAEGKRYLSVKGISNSNKDQDEPIKAVEVWVGDEYSFEKLPVKSPGTLYITKD